MTDPPRLLDDPSQLSPEEAAALRAGRQALPPQRIRHAVWASLLTQLSLTTTAAAGAGTSAGVLTWTTTKVALAAVLVTAGGVTAAELVFDEGSEPAELEQSAPYAPDDSQASSAPTAAADDVPEEARHGASPARGISSRGVPIERGVPIDPPASLERTDQTAAPPSTANRQALPSEAQTRKPSGAASQTQDDRRAVDTSDYDREAATVAAVRSLLAQARPSAALRELNELEASLERSLLGQERRVLRIEALFGLGRTAEARRLAEQFLKRHGESPLAARVRARLEH